MLIIMKFQLTRNNKNTLKAHKMKEEATFIEPEIRMTPSVLNSNAGG